MNWMEFFSMGGRGAFVWGAFGVFAAAIAVEVVSLRLRGRRARHEARDGGEAA